MFFVLVDDEWELFSQEVYQAGECDEYDFMFEVYIKK